jgi:DNA helicase-2/ATP-dependent DNA helicase PcrA
MDKKVVFAVAGSGKTTKIVQQLDEERRYLLMTYTEANKNNLRRKIIDRFGYFPPNIRLYTYFKFLHSFCYRPFLRSKKNTKGLTFKLPPQFPAYSLANDHRYMTLGRRLYSNRLAKFIEQTDSIPNVIARIEKYFDAFYVDEVQDFGGHDFNFLMDLVAVKLDCLFVGDFYQHTYDTSRDGNVNASLYNDYAAYQKKFKAAGMEVDTNSLKSSKRCSTSVCDFIADRIGIEITSEGERTSNVRFENDPDAVKAIYEDKSIVKLFYEEHYKYSCYSQNWGASKGIDHYQDVCVVLNPTSFKMWNTGDFKSLPSSSKNKLYVACSRARGNLTLISQNLLKTYKVNS